jgi:hypothetical protein
LVVSGAGTATAATTVFPTDGGVPVACSANTGYVQSFASPPLRELVGVGGVITQWQFRAGAGGGTVALQVLKGDSLGTSSSSPHPHRRDLRRRHLRVRGQQDRCSLTGALVCGLLRHPLQLHRLAVGEGPDENLRGTHRHLLGRDHASLFAAGAGFPVKRLEKGH